MESNKLKAILPLYLPWLMALSVSSIPICSFLMAWAGSFLIFYLSLLSPFRYHSLDLPIRKQIMRPIVLIQLIFAGFMCCSSIFYFLNHFQQLNGTGNFLETMANEETELLATCQRYSLLAHAALLSGIILASKRQPLPEYHPQRTANIPFKLGLITFPLAMLSGNIPAVIQLKYPLYQLSMSCWTYLFVRGIVRKRPNDLLPSGLFLCSQLYYATLTGYKEVIIVQLILVSCIAFHHYPKTVSLIFPILLILLLYVLPTFTSTIRNQAWVLGKSNEEARSRAYQQFFDEEQSTDLAEDSKAFLIHRMTEMGMFVQYVERVPEQHDGSRIIVNALYALIPRVLWPEKPATEKVAMERVYLFGIANRASNVSAKTRPIVDGYLMAGAVGIWAYMLCYGLCAQWLCNMAERRFGGYQFGTVILFNSLFQSLWRGNNLEFLLNTLCYGLLLMLLIHWILCQAKLLLRIPEETNRYNS